MACNGRHSSTRGIWLALLNSCFIAGYTLVDGTGVRLAGSAFGYTLWTFFMNGFCLLAWAMIARRREVSHYLVNNWKKGCLAALVPWARTAWRYGR
jgi:drug/metabolite transporter (DMT)-like permease